MLFGQRQIEGNNLFRSLHGRQIEAWASWNRSELVEDKGPNRSSLYVRGNWFPCRVLERSRKPCDARDPVSCKPFRLWLTPVPSCIRLSPSPAVKLPLSRDTRGAQRSGRVYSMRPLVPVRNNSGSTCFRHMWPNSDSNLIRARVLRIRFPTLAEMAKY